MEKNSPLEAERPTGIASVDWEALVDHRYAVAADDPMELVYREFRKTDAGFIAVLDQGVPVGLAARHAIGMRLGSQYGFSLFGKLPIRDHMIGEPLTIRRGQPWADVLHRVFSRTGDSFNQDVLLVDDEGGFLGLISEQTLVKLQTRLLTQSIAQLEQHQAEISRRNRQMTDDLLMAREMQLAMLPRDVPEVSAGFSLGRRSVRVLNHYAPLGVVSGDFFEVLAVSDKEIGILIADVMGHGVQAALVTAMVRALIQTHSHVAGDPGVFLTALNASLCEILEGCRLPMFASAFALVADLATGTLRYANAGHPAPMLLRRTAGRAATLSCDNQANGGLLGVVASTGYCMQETRLAEGDVVLMFTDGLFEVEGPDRDILGLERLLEFATGTMALPVDDLMPSLVERVRSFSPDGKFADDVCLVVLEIRELLGRG